MTLCLRHSILRGFLPGRGLPWGQPGALGDRWHCLEVVLTVAVVGGRKWSATGAPRGEAGDAGLHPTVHRAEPAHASHLAQHQPWEGQKPCSARTSGSQTGWHRLPGSELGEYRWLDLPPLPRLSLGRSGPGPGSQSNRGAQAQGPLG